MNPVSQQRACTVLIAHPSPDLYGSDRVMLETASGLIEAGHRVVVALPGEGPLVPALVARGAEPVVCPSPVVRKSSLSPLGLIRLAAESLRGIVASLRLLRRVRPSTILVNTVTIPLWVVVGRLAGIPVVCHVHEAERSASTAMRRMLYAPLLLTHGIIANSRFCLETMSSAWSSLAGRTEIIYNGVVGPEQPNLPRPTLDVPRLLFIGRLSPRKGPQVAVAAVRMLRERGIPVELSLLGAVFPGYEWFEAELREQVVAQGLDEAVTFLGFDPDVWAHIEACDIVLVPSTVDEPFGNTAVEAMLAQRPLVVSATTGLLEAASGYASARQVPPSDSEAIADAVADLVDDWSGVITQVVADRDLATSRHSPAVYRRQLANILAHPRLIGGRSS